SQLTQDKFQDLLNPGGIANGFVGGKKKSAFAATTTSSGFVPVAAGTIDSQILNNTGATTSPGEPIHCGVLGGASRWFGLRPSVDGIFIIDTIGSSIDTVLAVYTNDPANLLTPLQFVSCDNDGAPDGRRSLVRFPARGGVEYLVAVDGVNGAQGGINLNWKLGVLPVANGTNTPSVIRRGNSITLNANILAPTPDLRYQWRLNGENLAGATNSTLLVIVDQAAHAGSYSVIASNFAGVATNNVAALTMEIPFLSVQPAAQSGTLRVQFESVPAQGVVLQSSSDLVTWIPVYTNAISSPMPFVDIQTTSQLKQFLRALPWP
ncbi:MAG TPA: immunoglobulin domain-containing protein, partial [Terriglobales bacterium]